MWHEDILKSLINNEDEFTSNARRQLFKLELPAGIEKGVVKETKFAKTSDSKWLSKAQDKMLYVFLVLDLCVLDLDLSTHSFSILNRQRLPPAKRCHQSCRQAMDVMQ